MPSDFPRHHPPLHLAGSRRGADGRPRHDRVGRRLRLDRSVAAVRRRGRMARGLTGLPVGKHRNHVRWMQEIRRFKPSTVSRRFSVTAGFYRTCVIDGVLEHSPAEHVRRHTVPAESPTLGFTPCSSRPRSPRPGNPRARATSRWWACSGCWDCGFSKPPGQTSPIWAKNMATGYCACAAKAPNCPDSSATRGRPGDRPGDRHVHPRADSAQQDLRGRARPGPRHHRPRGDLT